MNKYEQIIIIGTGQIALEVLKYVKEFACLSGCRLLFIEHERSSFDIFQMACQKENIPYVRITEKCILHKFLNDIQEETLMVSAANFYIFPKEIVKKNNLAIINFHNALLPHFPGRNAPSWAIYENAKETGITWHYVTECVDEGDIIAQASCRILPDMKAYELEYELMKLAADAFKACFPDIYQRKAKTRKQEFLVNRKLYKSSEIPGNGRFMPDDPPQYVYRLLRATDYGKTALFPNMLTVYQGKEIEIASYRKIIQDQAGKNDGRIYLQLDDHYALRLSYTERRSSNNGFVQSERI